MKILSFFTFYAHKKAIGLKKGLILQTFYDKINMRYSIGGHYVSNNIKTFK